MLQDVLQRHGITPDPDRGQHFLADDAVVQQLVDAAGIAQDETVLDIGAGVGTITTALAAAAGRVHAYENDPAVAAALRAEVADLDNVEVREEDITGADLPDADACVANPPFHLSADLVDLLGGRRIRAVLVLQDAFVDKLVAAPGDSAYGRATVLARYDYTPVRLGPVPADAFHPEMAVDAAIVKLVPRNRPLDVDRERFRTIATALFTHRRKKVRNAVVDARHILDISKDAAKAMRDDLPHSEERVVDLDVHAVADIAAALDERRDR